MEGLRLRCWQVPLIIEYCRSYLDSSGMVDLCRPVATHNNVEVLYESRVGVTRDWLSLPRNVASIDDDHDPYYR